MKTLGCQDLNLVTARRSTNTVLSWCWNSTLGLTALVYILSRDVNEVSRSENQMRTRSLVISSRQYRDIWSSVQDETEIKNLPTFSQG